MDRTPVPWTLPATGIALAVAVGLAHWAYDPDPTVHLPFGSFLMGAVWLLVEWLTVRDDSDRAEAALSIRDWHRTVFLVAGLYTAVFSALKLAADTGLMSETLRIAASRGMGVSAGLLFAIWGNYLPKLVSPWRTEAEPFNWQGVHRFVGRLAALGGVVVAIGWLILPLDVAAMTTERVALVVAALAVGVKFYSVATHSPAAR